MSDMSNSDDRFWELAEGFIASANELCDNAERGEVTDALMYAASRFGAYLAAVSVESRKQFKEEQADIKALLLEQFELMLQSNLDDYLEHYKLYIGRDD